MKVTAEKIDAVVSASNSQANEEGLLVTVERMQKGYIVASLEECVDKGGPLKRQAVAFASVAVYLPEIAVMSALTLGIEIGIALAEAHQLEEGVSE